MRIIVWIFLAYLGLWPFYVLASLRLLPCKCLKFELLPFPQIEVRINFRWASCYH